MEANEPNAVILLAVAHTAVCAVYVSPLPESTGNLSIINLKKIASVCPCYVNG